MNFKFPKKLCALVLVLMCLWAIPALAQEAPGPTESAFVLPKLLVPAAGFQGAFVITEQSVQEVGELTGFFLLVDAFEGSYEERAIRVHYTVLSEDPEEGSARVRVRAQPLDPGTRELLGPAQWEGIYELTEYGVLWEWESDIPPAYADLVQPAWLVEWSATPYEDLPEGAIEPGTTWAAPLQFELSDLDVDDPGVPMTGHFVGWVEIPGAAGPVAHVAESYISSSTVQQEIFQGVFADQSIDFVVNAEHWLIPGHFPYGVERSVHVSTRAQVGPETGAPPGFEGGFEVIFSMEQSIESDPDAHVVWLEWTEDDEVYAGQEVAGVLGPWSEQFGDGTFMRVYTYRGKAGESVDIRLESPDFDAYLLLYSEDFEVLDQDDDSAGGTDSRIVHNLPYTGLYYIVVNTIFPDEEGEYTLWIE